MTYLIVAFRNVANPPKLKKKECHEKSKNAWSNGMANRKHGKGNRCSHSLERIDEITRHIRDDRNLHVYRRQNLTSDTEILGHKSVHR